MRKNGFKFKFVLPVRASVACSIFGSSQCTSKHKTFLFHIPQASPALESVSSCTKYSSTLYKWDVLKPSMLLSVCYYYFHINIYFFQSRDFVTTSTVLFYTKQDTYTKISRSIILEKYAPIPNSKIVRGMVFVVERLQVISDKECLLTSVFCMNPNCSLNQAEVAKKFAKRMWKATLHSLTLYRPTAFTLDDALCHQIMIKENSSVIL